MKKTYQEKLIAGCNRIVKKHTWLKGIMMLYMTAALFCYHVGLKFVTNGKRYSCAALLLLFLVVSSSFAFPESLSGQNETVSPEAGGAQLAAEQEINTEEVAFIEADNIEQYDDALLSEEELDTYTLDEILESNALYEEVTETGTEPSGQTEPQGEEKTDYSDYVFDAKDWRLILVNKQHSIPEDYTFPLGTITGSMQCDERILEDLLAMMKAAKEDGVDLVICSPYRDYKRQTYLFERKITRYMNAGMSYMDAYKTASMTVTSPNASEHRIGLAIDFYSSTYKSLDEGFADTQTGKWLAEHSCEYGFILRYPKGKEYITGIEYEPWHFRYVGIEAATVITDRGITLEEFWEDL
ncbi:MAG: M15 family metallopeptidase [Lachnospiraceae bacterium]|nr:M15 family metallopeptidase [Lachnospiraceae bacterium]